MDATTQLSDVLLLGKRLVAELDSDDRRDTLSHWMAHHIAGLISRLESHRAESKAGLEEECRRAILELWSYRSSLPGRSRPFRNLEGLLQTVESLNPDCPSFYYARELANSAGVDNELDVPSKQWLSVAHSIDRGARALIGYCIFMAAEDSANQAADWVELARKVGSNLDTDIRLIRIIIDNSSTLTDALPESDRSSVLNVLRQRVEILDAMALAMADVRQRLIDKMG